MTYYVSSGTINLTHSLTHSPHGQRHICRLKTHLFTKSFSWIFRKLYFIKPVSSGSSSVLLLRLDHLKFGIDWLIDSLYMESGAWTKSGRTLSSNVRRISNKETLIFVSILKLMFTKTYNYNWCTLARSLLDVVRIFSHGGVHYYIRALLLLLRRLAGIIFSAACNCTTKEDTLRNAMGAIMYGSTAQCVTLTSKRVMYIVAWTCTFRFCFSSYPTCLSSQRACGWAGEETVQCVRSVICRRRRLMKDGIQEAAAAAAAAAATFTFIRMHARASLHHTPWRKCSVTKVKGQVFSRSADCYNIRRKSHTK